MPLNNNNAMEYFGNDTPKCPYCDREIDIQSWELFELYNEDGHEIECPFCEKEIRVVSRSRYTFSTDEQLDDE